MTFSISVLDKLSNDVREIAENLQNIVNTFRNIKYYLFNPNELMILIWNLIVRYSKPVCLIVCFGGVLTYLIGAKKGAKVATGSILAYTIIKIFSAALGVSL